MIDNISDNSELAVLVGIFACLMFPAYFLCRKKMWVMSLYAAGFFGASLGQFYKAEATFLAAFFICIPFFAAELLANAPDRKRL